RAAARRRVETGARRNGRRLQRAEIFLDLHRRRDRQSRQQAGGGDEALRIALLDAAGLVLENDDAAAAPGAGGFLTEIGPSALVGAFDEGGVLLVDADEAPGPGRAAGDDLGGRQLEALLARQ